MENLKNEAKKIRMTPGEKQAMRLAVFGAPSVVAAPSPYFFFNFQFIQTRVLAPLAIVLLVGSGTAYAAEGALPGDALYPVKIYVNESVAEALAYTPAAKAEVHTSLAERRVAEAQALASEGRLDATTTEALAASVEAHAAVAESQADRAEEEEAGSGREARTKLAVVLDTNARVLARLGGADEEASENAQELAMRLIARAEGPGGLPVQALAKAAPAAMEAMSLSVGAADEAPREPQEDLAAARVAASLERDAAEALADARARFAKNKASFDATTTAQVAEELARAGEEIGQGSAQLGTAAYAQAEAHFTEALKASLRLSALLKAHQKFDGDLISPLLDLRGGDPQDAPGANGESSADPAQVEILDLDLDVEILEAL